MKFDQNYQRKLLNDVVARRFDEANDLCHFVQIPVGKPDVIYSLRLVLPGQAPHRLPDTD